VCRFLKQSPAVHPIDIALLKIHTDGHIIEYISSPGVYTKGNVTFRELMDQLKAQCAVQVRTMLLLILLAFLLLLLLLLVLTSRLQEEDEELDEDQVRLHEESPAVCGFLQ